MPSLPANNSSERIGKAQEKLMSNLIVIDNYSATALSSSEQLANQFAAVKIVDSKENLVEVVAEGESKASLNDVPAKNASKGSLDNLAKNNNSKGSIIDLAKNRSNASLNKSEASISMLSRSNSRIVAVESVNEEAKKSVDDLVAVSLNETKEAGEAGEAGEVADENAPETVATETSSLAPVAVQSTEALATIQAEGEEEPKKSCLAQKAAKCRCIIS